jgi:pilus assembly protein Flp/PilA
MDMVAYWQKNCAPYLRAIFGRRSERGAALVEYALLLALIAVVCIVALTTLGTQAKTKFSTVGTSIAAAG